jgi:alkylation response protein AidB-like acyl-CoA dehydrogenase
MNFELSDDMLELQRRARAFVDTEAQPHYKQWPITVGEYSPELKAHLKAKLDEYGLTKLIVPKDHGGQGLGAMADVIVLTELSKVPRRMPTGPFAPWPVMYKATEAIKRKYLYPVIEGQTGWSMCFTEPETGSDLAAIKTTAVRKGGKWVINGRKMWRTGHHGASYTAVAAVTDAAKGYKGISIFLVDNDTPGFREGARHPGAVTHLGHRAGSEAENVEVPENLLGDEGAGFRDRPAPVQSLPDAPGRPGLGVSGTQPGAGGGVRHQPPGARQVTGQQPGDPVDADRQPVRHRIDPLEHLQRGLAGDRGASRRRGCSLRW